MLSFENLVRIAKEQHASDIHVHPRAQGADISVRVQGRLQALQSCSLTEAERLLAQVRVACGLDVSVRQLPQDGRFQLAEGISGRVSLLPTLHGSACVVRLFELLSAPSLEVLGFSAAQAQCLQQCVSKPFGLVVVAGPTGSGKTTTLYHLLRQAKRPDRVLLTLEDPIEAEIIEARQTACRPELGLDFASGLRALLRQDPDVILVGEIRDAETAQMAVRAALTGHLVMTSVHARDTVEVLYRLLDLGVPAFQLAATLSLAVAQRWEHLNQPQRRLKLEILQYPDNLFDILETPVGRDVLTQKLEQFIISNY